MHFFFQAEDGIRDYKVTGVQTCALPISASLDGMDSGAFAEARTLPRRCARGSGGGVPSARREQLRGGCAAVVQTKIGRASCREREWGAVMEGAVKGKRGQAWTRGAETHA